MRVSHAVVLPLTAGLSLTGPWIWRPSTSSAEVQNGPLSAPPEIGLYPPQAQPHMNPDRGRSSRRAPAPGGLQMAAWPFAPRALLQSLFVAQAEGPGVGVPVSLKKAYHASLLQPLLSYMPDLGRRAAIAMTPEALQQLEAAALTGFDGASDPLQVVSIAWTLAWFGHKPGQPYIEKLQAAAAAGSLLATSGSSTTKHQEPLSASHSAVLLWCVAMHGVATPTVWDAGLRAVAAATPAAQSVHALNECAFLYLLHAAMLYAVDAAAPGTRAATAAGGRTVSPTSPAAASATSPACQPRATREEVLAVAAPLGRKALAKLGQAYGEYVPLHPAVEGPYMALLFVLVQLAAAAAVRGGGDATAGDGWLPPGAPEAAAAVLSKPKELARIRRDLLYHWRGDELVDLVQRARNQVIYLLTRRMGLTVSQPEDVDVAVPSRWIAMYVRDGGGVNGGGNDVAWVPYSPDGGQAVKGDGGVEDSTIGALEAVTEEALELLVRERFAPVVRMPAYSPVSGLPPPPQQPRQQVDSSVGARGEPAGMWAARVRQLQRLGWRVLVVDVATWQGLSSDVEREAYLLRLVRGRG